MTSLSHIRVRPCGRESAETLRNTMIRCWTGSVPANSSAFRETVEDVAAELVRGAGALLLDGDDVIGGGRYSPVPGPAGDAAEWVEFKRIGLLAAWRGRGLGLLIPRFLEASARARGFGGAQLGIRADRPLMVGFWERLGFQRADDVELQTANPLTPPPICMRKRF